VVYSKSMGVLKKLVFREGISWVTNLIHASYRVAK
jgi:hypothetical protein